MPQRNITFPPLLFVFVLFCCQKVLSSPVPQIIEPDPGPLSFLELVQTTLYRIIEVGFLKGILTSLLVLECLVCLLIGALSGLAAYLRHHDTKLWERHEELYVFEDGKNEEEESSPVERHMNGSGHRNNDTSPSQTPSRISRYLSRNTSIPVTKISIHASPCRTSTTNSVLSNSVLSAPAWIPRTPIRSPVRPLRSALSKSPPSSRRTVPFQTPLFGSSEVSVSSTSPPNPKSVHWADEVQMTTMEIIFSRDRAISTKGRPGVHIATDTRICRIDGHDLDISDALADLSSPLCHSYPIFQTHKHKSTFATSCIQVQDAEFLSDGTTSMKLEGDTS
ncbi:uncharacterized protein PV07_02435 [Cladophialophora immunda]|uniref:Copper transporter n=1 Tax=Cladophialophora immunda TaxID=569365 RepID=A0A0D1ZRQ0_9EURO|nr:uncharacterized protein PV07_02435 [Cladophialophora immunda]KIW30731.1 hypothetical protein PV07_02435 [Cladophialophora immunda]